MDIQVASNFERALFEASGRDEAWTAQAMRDFAATRRLTIAPQVLESLQARYVADAADDEETLAAIARTYGESGIMVDPHTAVAIAVADKFQPPPGPTVILSTAHPAKFPEAVERATGRRPELPPQLSDLMAREERFTVLPNSAAAVRDFVIKRARAA